jgi:MFS family permease
MMAMTVVSGAVTQLPAGRISDRTDRRYVIAAAATAAALVGFVILALRPIEPWLVVTLVGCYGALTYPIYGLAVAHANDYAEPSEFVAVSGGLLLLYGAGTMFGPLAAGAAMTEFGPEALFLVTALSHVSIAAYALYRTYKRAPIPGAVREAYQTTPSTPVATPATAALDPRAEDATVIERGDAVAVK